MDKLPTTTIYATITITFHGSSPTPLFGAIDTSIHIYTSTCKMDAYRNQNSKQQLSQMSGTRNHHERQAKPDDDRHHRR